MGIETIELVLRVALVVDAIALIALVMIQQGKGANVGAAFGSGASQTMFGSAGASSFLNTLTTWLAIGFFVITFALAWAARERAQSLGSVGIPQVEDLVPAQTDGLPETIEFDLEDVPSLSVDAAPASEVPASDVPSIDDAEVPSEAP